MGLLILLLLLIFFAWLAIAVDRRIQARKQAHAAAVATQPASEPQPNQGRRVPWRRSQPTKAVTAFRTWAVSTFADQPTIQHWLAALGDDAIELLTAKLSDFCHDLGFEFDWLLEHKVDEDHVLAPRLQAIVVQYIEACYQAVIVQDEVKAFQAWQDFAQHPYRKEQQALAQRLLARLLAEGLTPPAAQSLLTAPEKEREIYIVQAVREAAEKHPAAFRAVLKTVLNPSADPAPGADTSTKHRVSVWPHPPNGAQPIANGQPTTPHR